MAQTVHLELEIDGNAIHGESANHGYRLARAARRGADSSGATLGSCVGTGHSHVRTGLVDKDHSAGIDP